MKVVFFAGGFGTRMNEDVLLKPKPMIEIGGIPLLCHLMNIYYSYGFNEFIILAGYKHEYIKNYFMNYRMYLNDIEIYPDGEIKFINPVNRHWQITIVNTGTNTQTGSRLKKIEHILANDKKFFLTYGDGISDVNILNLLQFHDCNKKIMTLTSVPYNQSFGIIEKNNNQVLMNSNSNIRINGGFFICSNSIFDYIDEGRDDIIFEEKISELMLKNEVAIYEHNKIWYCMDTQKDKLKLEKIFEETKFKNLSNPNV